jgi:predicted alpha/beta hydrolase
MTHNHEPRLVTIPARDGYELSGTMYHPHGDGHRMVVINPAIAVPGRFYRHFAAGLAGAGYAALTWDYRGIGASKHESLRGSPATARDWVLLDMAGVIDWAASKLEPESIFLVGHSLGGQAAGLLDNASSIDGMVTMSAQSGHWRLQGGEQKLVVLLHAWVTLPLLSRIFGYMPWGILGSGEDLPKGAALEWAGWCRNRQYLLGDSTLPLHRYRSFTAPVLAYSFGDDKWGTPRSVDAMMQAYPVLERRHVEPSDFGLAHIGHVGFFKPGSESLWRNAIAWLDGR